jgi:hypothetical protein
MPLLIYFPFIVWSGVVMRMFEAQPPNSQWPEKTPPASR